MKSPLKSNNYKFEKFNDRYKLVHLSCFMAQCSFETLGRTDSIWRHGKYLLYLLLTPEPHPRMRQHTRAVHTSRTPAVPDTAVHHPPPKNFEPCAPRHVPVLQNHSRVPSQVSAVACRTSLEATTALLAELVRRLTTVSGWPPHKLHLFGFSQGGTAALHLTRQLGWAHPSHSCSHLLQCGNAQSYIVLRLRTSSSIA